MSNAAQYSDRRRLIEESRKLLALLTAKDQMACRVAWEYRDGSKNGHGQPIFTFDEAESIAAKMNAEYPEILHWPEPCFA
jgi:hypothetical protein